MKDFSIFTLAWQSKAGNANFNPSCDFNENGIINVIDLALFALHWTWLLKVHVFIFPQTLNLKSRGNWVTGIICLPKGVDVSEVDISSIRLNDTIAADSTAHTCRFSNHLMVKFSREAVIALIQQDLGSGISISCRSRKSMLVSLTVSGTTFGGLKFFGSDVIRVIHNHE